MSIPYDARQPPATCKGDATDGLPCVNWTRSTLPEERRRPRSSIAVGLLGLIGICASLRRAVETLYEDSTCLQRSHVVMLRLNIARRSRADPANRGARRTRRSAGCRPSEGLLSYVLTTTRCVMHVGRWRLNEIFSRVSSRARYSFISPDSVRELRSSEPRRRGMIERS